MHPGRTENVTTDSVSPIDQESAKEEREEWPVVKLMHAPKSSRLRFAPSTPPPGYERSADFLTQHYHPECAPNVLTPQEARAVIAWVIDEETPQQTVLAEAVFDRLAATYAKEQS